MTDETPDDVRHPRFIAVVDMVRRTGCKEFQIRHDDEEEPTVWTAVAVYPDGRFDAGAGPGPFMALCRLADQLIDGGQCVHCKRPTGFSADTDPLPAGDAVCWQQYDPETRKVERGCR